MSDRSWADTDLVFDRGDGAPRDLTAHGRRMRRLLDSVGLSDVRPYNLRHLFATAALDEGRPVHHVSAVLGHFDEGFTLRTYSHVIETAPDEVADAIERAFG